jgi:anti-sigma regulatory factor (Ser/Thr protein kinase)
VTPRVHRMELEPKPEAIHRARRFVRTRVADCIATEQVEVAELLTSELVTNAIIHTGAPVELCVQVEVGHVRIEVSDHSDEQPVLRTELEPFAIHGRGLQFVEELATLWGVDTEHGAGKCVWFEIDLAG